MIQANELRIGNWIDLGYCKSEIVTIGMDGISFVQEHYSCLQYEQYAMVSPIPLTPEILEKAGFQNRSQTTDYYFVNGDVIIGGSCSTLYPSIHGDSGLWAIGKEIKFVHQLQNLYFALTGQELTIAL